MTTEVMTPFSSRTPVVELSTSGLWRKQILKFDTINYTDRHTGETRQITFDRQYAQDLIRAFKDRAYSQVPFQLATAENLHNNDPRNTGGELVGMELSADGTGLDGILRLWGSGEEVVASNGKLGVSVRVLENLEKPDGRRFPKALQHVLGTVDPQLPDMNPWQKVELSNHGTVTESLDLSNATYGRAGMPEQKDKTQVLELTAAQVARLRGLDDTDAAQELTKLLDQVKDREENADEELTDEEIAQLMASIEAEDDEDPDEDEDTEDEKKTELSSAKSGAVELANATLQHQGAQITELTNALNQTRLEGEVEKWRHRGLAPAVIEAARPLLAVPTGAVELSNGIGASLDPGQVVRNLLDTVVELSNQGMLVLDEHELGGLAGTDPNNSERKALLESWATEYGN